MPTVMGQERERERGGERERGQALWDRVTGSSVQLPAASVINNAIFTHVTQMAANGRVGSSKVRGRRGEEQLEAWLCVASRLI